MPTPLETLIASGTKLWLDSIDPELIVTNRKLGATGATSNPIIVADLIRSNRFDDRLAAQLEAGHDDTAIAWNLTDGLVSEAQEIFQPVWEATRGNDGYVSFELDPLIEDTEAPMPHAERVQRYIELGLHWSKGHPNRMIKVPATPAGIDALETLAAEGLSLNVTLVFTQRQYEAARDAVWRGAQRRASLALFKSVYSIFVSRVDVYAQKHVPMLAAEAAGLVGIVNAKRMWQQNQTFWQGKDAPLDQEIVFASTGTKNADDPPDKYIAALAGSDIQTNPPKANDLVQTLGKSYTRQVDQMPDASILDAIDRHIDATHLESILMEEGLAKFADPQKGLIATLGQRRAQMAGTGR